MKILFATDGSAHARIAELILMKTPRWREAEIHVVTVVAPFNVGASAFDPTMGVGYAQEIDDAWKEVKKQAHEVTQTVADRLGPNAKPVILEGDVAEQLLDYAKDEQIDMVAIGSRGFGAMRSFFLGSVARRLLSYSPVTVLIGRAAEGQDPEECCTTLEVKQDLDVLVCYDGTDGANLVLDKICMQGHNAFEKVVILCAEPLSRLPSGINPADFGDTYRYDHPRAKELVQSAVSRLEDCSRHTVGLTNLGRPSEVLVAAAKDQGVDLIALGATRHGFIERFLLGSVSFEVATTAPCSVLVVRPPREG